MDAPPEIARLKRLEVRDIHHRTVAADPSPACPLFSVAEGAIFRRQEPRHGSTEPSSALHS
jgi:hypothetical protein